MLQIRFYVRMAKHSQLQNIFLLCLHWDYLIDVVQIFFDKELNRWLCSLITNVGIYLIEYSLNMPNDDNWYSEVECITIK